MTRDTIALIMCSIVSDSHGPNAVALLQLLQDVATLGPAQPSSDDEKGDIDYFELPVHSMVGELLLKFSDKRVVDHRSNPRMLEHSRLVLFSFAARLLGMRSNNQMSAQAKSNATH